ncbi:GerAB/ArcD/ProY family transporter [Brevibacillus sp. SYSU BS000544]|uniref:GerAB/ArcD/ProY family transporter n=1 Tax=Brevibacillus sp. SYSU BS000544 TaxID=3416443 RepID=UPI003CE52169
MKRFEYADAIISKKELYISISSMVIGVGILTLPRTIATDIESSDGWISILTGGVIALIFAWLLAKLAARFPRMTFFEYTSKIVSKPVSYVLTFLMSAYLLLFVSYEIRSVGIIAKQYLFDITPVEVITFVFLLVLIYAVSGPSIGIIRLNVLFFPIVLLIVIFVLIFTIQLIEKENLQPMFITGVKPILSGIKDSVFSFLGFEIVLFYTALMKRPQDAPKAAMIGLSIPILLYTIIYLFTVGVFSSFGTKNLVFPTIELAKEVELPGAFLERVDSIFFTVWIMTIFNTSSMAYDLSVMLIRSILPQCKKITLISVLAFISYVLSMLPQNFNQLSSFGEIISISGVVIGLLMPMILLVIAILRGVKANA